MRFLDLLRLILENLNRRKGRVLVDRRWRHHWHSRGGDIGIAWGRSAKEFHQPIGRYWFIDTDQRLSQITARAVREWSWQAVVVGAEAVVV